MKENELNPELNIEAAVFQMERFVEQTGLQQVTVSKNITRAGAPNIVLEADRKVALNLGSGLEQITEGDSTLLIKQIAATFNTDKKDRTSTELLTKQVFVDSCVTELQSKEIKANQLLAEFLPNRNLLPVIYGSTSGINAAEVMETLICSEDSEKNLGNKTHVIFDFTGCDDKKAKEIFEESLAALDTDSRTKAVEFVNNLGKNLTEQILNAAKTIFAGKNITFVNTEEIFEKLGKDMTVGKLLLLAKLTGNDPIVLGGEKASDILRLTNKSKQGLELLATSVAETGLKPGGFTFYAREAIIGADIPGSFVAPIKLTDKANIYKILESYNALNAQSQDGGVILAPIQRQRIQVPSQIERQTGDPIDIRVLAFLAVNSPTEFAQLADDFRQQCKVLTPAEAILNGVKDNKINIGKYFKEIK